MNPKGFDLKKIDANDRAWLAAEKLDPRTRSF